MEEKDINEIIGKNLLLLRKNKKLTQLEVAEKFNYSDKSISKWEKGESLPSIEVLIQLANFYNITLDELTSEHLDLTVARTEKTTKPSKVRTPRMFPAKMIISLLSIVAVWLLATTFFVIFKLTIYKNYYMFFIWAIPVSFVVAIVFNSIWGKIRYLFIFLTFLTWSALAAIHLQILIIGFNAWPVYILGCPLQLLIILWGALVKKPKGYYKNLFNKTKSNTAPQQEQSEEQQ